MIPQKRINSPHSPSGCPGMSSHSSSAQSPCIDSPPMLKPPVSVVFLDNSRSILGSDLRPTTSPLKSPHLCLNRSFSSATAATSSASPSSEEFRLQPRHNLKCLPLTVGHNAVRIQNGCGRKRRAGSLNDTSLRSRIEKPEPKDLESDPAIFDLSPILKTERNKSFLTKSSESVDGTALNLHCLSLKSPKRRSPGRPPTGPETASQPSLGSSSFSKYNHSLGPSPRRLIFPKEPDESRCDEATRSPALSSIFSSPKIMPLKVLLHNGPRTPSSTRPPLHTTPTSTRNSHNWDEKEGSPLLSVRQINMACSPESSLSTLNDSYYYVPSPKQRKILEINSPGSKKSTRTPPRIPKISLTPRSDRLSAYSNSDSINNEFPSPPRGLPTDNDLTGESQRILQRAYEQESSIALTERSGSLQAPPSRPSSFIPLPDWGEPNSSSWFSDPNPGIGFQEGFLDSTSLSDDDLNDEMFVLASPAVIAEEKNPQSSLKHRRLRPVAESTGHLSTTSLLGINFISSSTCLATMEGKPSTGSFPLQCRFPNKPSSPSGAQPQRNESHSPVGLTLDSVQPMSSERDLVTPPTLPQLKEPPALSPHVGHDNQH